MIDLELAHATWRKSSRSGSTGGECVEVASVGAMSAVRDSKNRAGDLLVVPHGAWGALLTEIKRGAYDL
ncbi:DUF397 domain-containing protein [Actinomadura sp. WMMB 499]|uniref:DUF397 domain-containing protein n=1 Tax=Actinomadura sp. WMMB 499 TaxID=1219491 RepID=UPI001248C41A|nr:DUF397 domain-containing protein [Actinomadura sp. WMMB 499]QFG20355.1 DUF397 domain-containing protein [Actinomadura sp. WMMB 499]